MLRISWVPYVFYGIIHPFFPLTHHFVLFFIQEGVVYAVEFSPRSGRDLINMAKKRTNVIRAFIHLAFLV